MAAKNYMITVQQIFKKLIILSLETKLFFKNPHTHTPAQLAGAVE